MAFGADRHFRRGRLEVRPIVTAGEGVGNSPIVTAGEGVGSSPIVISDEDV
jgi:hypothetical protein